MGAPLGWGGACTRSLARARELGRAPGRHWQGGQALFQESPPCFLLGRWARLLRQLCPCRLEAGSRRIAAFCVPWPRRPLAGAWGVGEGYYSICYHAPAWHLATTRLLLMLVLLVLRLLLHSPATAIDGGEKAGKAACGRATQSLVVRGCRCRYGRAQLIAAAASKRLPPRRAAVRRLVPMQQ